MGFVSYSEDIDERRLNAIGHSSVVVEGSTRKHKPIRYPHHPTRGGTSSGNAILVSDRRRIRWQELRTRIEKYERAIKDARGYAGYLWSIIKKERSRIRRLEEENRQLRSSIRI